MKTYYRHHLPPATVISIGRARVRIMEHCGTIEGKENETKAYEKAKEWFKNNPNHEADTHRLVISKSVLYTAIIEK